MEKQSDEERSKSEIESDNSVVIFLLTYFSSVLISTLIIRGIVMFKWQVGVRLASFDLIKKRELTYVFLYGPSRTAGNT